METRKFYEFIVIPTVAEYLDDVQNRRLGFLAATTVYHFPEHVFTGREPDVRAAEKAVDLYRRGYENKPWLLALESFVNSFKHGVLRKTGFSMNESWSASPAIFGNMVLGESFLGDWTGGVYIELAKDSNHCVKLSEVLSLAMRTYESDFHELSGREPRRSDGRVSATEE